MKTFSLRLDSEIESKVLKFLSSLPNNKVIIEEIKDEPEEKINPWAMLREVNIDLPSDASVEHDHYIRGTPKITKNK